MKRIVQANIKRQKHQATAKYLMFMSAKTVSSNIIPAVNQNGSILYNIFAMKVAMKVALVYLLLSQFFC